MCLKDFHVQDDKTTTFERLIGGLKTLSGNITAVIKAAGAHKRIKEPVDLPGNKLWLATSVRHSKTF